MNVKDLLKNTELKSIEPYETHVSYCQDYANFLYQKDSKYTHEKIPTMRNVERADGTLDVEYFDDLKERRLLGTHKYICGLFANLMFSENTELKMDSEGNERNLEALKQFYHDKGIWQEIETAMFEVFGVGTVGMCVYKDPSEGVRVTAYSAYNILPIEIIDKQIKDVIFRSVKDNGNIVLNIFMRRKVNEDTVQKDAPTIRKSVYKGYTNYIYEFTKDGKQEGEVLKQEYDYRPFAILKPFEMGTDKYTKAIGQPVYWDSLDILKVIDNHYNLGNNDAELSKKQTLLAQQMIKDPVTGKLCIPHSLRSAHFISVNANEANSSDFKNFIHTHAPSMIVGEYYEQVEWNLKILSQRLHLGANELTIEKILAPTATEVIANNTEKYATVQKHLTAMYNELTVLNSAILYALDDPSLDPTVVIGFKLDDGVIEDRATIIERGLSLLNSGAISNYTFLTEYMRMVGDERTKELERLGYSEDGMSTAQPIAPILEE